MKELKTEKKTEGQTYNRTESVQDFIGHKHDVGPDFVGPGYHPPERFVPLLAKLSHPANATQRAQLFVQLQRHYGNRYVQKVVAAYRSQNAEEDESELAYEILSKKGSGRPLEPEVKEFMESRFGRDFSDTRIHTDSFATGTAQDLGAEAFTIGRDVFFGAGWYNPSSAKGKRLIAHELTHVVQQRNAIVQQNKGSIDNSGDVYEREADSVAESGLILVRGRLRPPIIELEAAPAPAPAPTPHTIPRSLCGAPIIVDNFEVGEYTLRPRHYHVLLDLATALRPPAGTEAMLLIEGYADSSGSERMNVGLSLQRAMEVVGFLTRAGARLQTVVDARGERDPVVSNATPAGRARNRRVEIRHCRPPPARVPLPAPIPV
jgi:flagellar motor protein MotB